MRMNGTREGSRRKRIRYASAVLFAGVALVAPFARSYAGCWASNSAGTRQCHDFKGRVSDQILTLCEDSPGDCAAEGYSLVTTNPHSRRPPKPRVTVQATPELTIPIPSSSPEAVETPSQDQPIPALSNLQLLGGLICLFAAVLLLAFLAKVFRRGLPGSCTYCGEKTSPLRWQHEECAEKNRAAWANMVSAATEAARSGVGLVTLRETLSNIALGGKVPLDRIREAEVAGFEGAVATILDSSVISPTQESLFVSFMKATDLTQEDLNTRGLWSRMVKGCILSDITSGNLKSRISAASLPFNFQKGEILLWAFQNCSYAAEKAHRSYVGGSSGVSFRIARGVYYRVGAFKGHSVETTSLDHVDTGILAITQKNLYFAGPHATFRIAITKIVSLVPYSNGFGLFRDKANAKREVFFVDDPWFAHNLLSHITPE